MIANKAKKCCDTPARINVGRLHRRSDPDNSGTRCWQCFCPECRRKGKPMPTAAAAVKAWNDDLSQDSGPTSSTSGSVPRPKKGAK